MRDSTRKLVGRLRQLIKEAAEGSRRAKAHVCTPFEQRPPLDPQPDWAKRAHLLCAVRAAMRGRLHRQAWLGLEQQKVEIMKIIEDAVKWENGWHQQVKVHPTFPAWLRAAVLAVVVAIEADKVWHLKRGARREAHHKLPHVREAG